MANLSNINNKFLFTDGDFLKIGNLAPINNISGTESGISITNGNVASITLDNTAASGKRYVMYSSGNGSLVFWDGDAAVARLQIDSSGNSTFAGTGTFTTATNRILTLDSTTTSGGYTLMSFKQLGTEQFRIFGNHTENYLSFYNDQGTGHQLTLASDGNVGIATASPSSYDADSDNLVVFDSANAGITIATSDLTGKSSIRFSDGTTGSRPYIGGIEYLHSDNSMRFDTAAVEKMRITSGGNINLGTGSLGQVSYQLRVDSDFDNGIYMSAGSSSSNYAMYIEKSAGGTSIFNVRGDGYVGIGTDTPAYKLDIRNGELTVRPSSSGNGGLGKIGHSSNNAILQLYDSSATEDVRISTSLSSYFNGGNVGIGTTVPQALLDVSKNNTTIYDPTDDLGQRAGTATIHIANQTATTNTFGQLMYDSRSSGQGIARIVFLNGGSATVGIAFVTEHTEVKSEKMRIQSNGNVGIGTASPDANLQVNRNTSTANLFDFLDVVANFGNQNSNPGNHYPSGIRIYQGSGTMGSGLAALNIGVDTNSALAVNGNTATIETPNGMTQGLRFSCRDSNAFIRFNTDSTERMRITSTGAISVGSSGTAYGTAGQVLTSNGNASPSWQDSSGSPFGQALKTYSSSANVTVATTVNASTVTNLSSGHITITASTGGNVIVKTFGIYETSNLWFKDEASPDIENGNNDIVIACSGNATNTLTFTVGDPTPVTGYGMTVSIQASPPGFFNL